MTKYLSNCSRIPAQIVPESSQNRPKMGVRRLLGPSRASPERPRSVQEPQDAPKSAPRAHKRAPRAPQQSPREPQERPRGAHERPKTIQKRAPEAPRRVRSAAQEGFRRDIEKTSVFAARPHGPEVYRWAPKITKNR